MISMLVLIEHPEDIKGRLSELVEVAKRHRVINVFLASVSRPFGARVRSRVSPRKLKTALTMSDDATMRYLSTIADVLRQNGMTVEAIRPGIQTEELDLLIKKSNIHLLVGTKGFSELMTHNTKVTNPSRVRAVLLRES